MDDNSIKPIYPSAFDTKSNQEYHPDKKTIDDEYPTFADILTGEIEAQEVKGIPEEDIGRHI